MSNNAVAMGVLWIVIPVAFVFAALAIWAFIWTVRTGQMDDLDTPASRILIEDETPDKPNHDQEADS